MGTQSVVVQNGSLSPPALHEDSKTVGTGSGLSLQADQAKSKVKNAISQINNLCSRFKNAVTGKGHENTMSRVADGLSVVMSVVAAGPRAAVASAKFAGKQLSELAKKRPVLAMALGISGVIFGGLLCSVEPFMGIALTSAAVYTIAKSFKPVKDILEGFVQKTKSTKDEASNVSKVKEDSLPNLEISVVNPEDDRKDQ